MQLLKQQKNHIGQKTELFNVKTRKNLTKAELLQEDILRHLFICQRRFSNEVLLLPISVLKVEYQVGIVFSISNSFINKIHEYVLYLHSRRSSYETN